MKRLLLLLLFTAVALPVTEAFGTNADEALTSSAPAKNDVDFGQKISTDEFDGGMMRVKGKSGVLCAYDYAKKHHIHIEEAELIVNPETKGL